MYGNINIINPENFIQAFQDMNCGKTELAQLSSKDFEIVQRETKPLEGYVMPDGFPNCCEGHKQIFQIGLERLAAFPNCCESHKALNSASWFNKANYSYMPLKLVTTIA